LDIDDSFPEPLRRDPEKYKKFLIDPPSNRMKLRKQ